MGGVCVVDGGDCGCGYGRWIVVVFFFFPVGVVMVGVVTDVVVLVGD